MTEETYNNTKPKKGNSAASLIVFIIILLAALIVYFYVKNMLPEAMMAQGKQAYDAGQYEKACKLFDKVSAARPFNSEAINYQVLSLSKMQPTYETLKKLYEIAQYEDFENESELAERVLDDIRARLINETGPNYADNILYEDMLLRWNNSKPITYNIKRNNSLPEEYYNMVHEAFNNWQNVSDGLIAFNEINNAAQANIVINFVDTVSLKDKYNPKLSGAMIPVITGDTLERADIYLKKKNKRGDNFENHQMLALAMHEIGHALGIGGHSANPDDVMYYNGDIINDNTYSKDLTERDINTLKILYKMVPDVIDVSLKPSENDFLIYHEIITAYPGENFEYEIQKLLEELEHDRKNVVAWVDLAIRYAYKRQYARSNHILNNILPLVKADFQNQFVIFYNLAVNYYKLKDYDSSAKYLGYAENLKTDLDTLILDAFIDVRQKRFNVAEQKLLVLKEKYPANIEISLKLAEIYHRENKSKEAQAIIADLISANPKALRDKRVLKYRAQN